MSMNLTNSFATLKIRFLAIMLMFVAPLSVFGQELGEPLIGPEILSDTIQIEHNSFANCALQNTGKVFCWGIGLRRPNTSVGFSSNAAGSSALNAALNNDIARITLDSVHLCGIGRESGIACVPAVGRDFIANGSVQSPQEPDASYRSISDLGPLNSAAVCAIQTDNRVVCWGSTLFGNDNVRSIPPEAAYLKEVDVESSRACGIDLNNSVVCWGHARSRAGVDVHFGDVDIATIGPVKQITLGRYGACVIDMNNSLECFGAIKGFTNLFSGVSLSSIEIDADATFFTSNVLCYETTSGENDCQVLEVSEDGASSDSIFSPEVDVRLISSRNGVCYVTKDEVMNCTLSGDSPDQNQFPIAPKNLSFNLYSDTQGELNWSRPSADFKTSEFASGYEIFRDGVLIARLPVVTSYYDSNTNPNARYEVRATRGLVAGTSAFVNADGSNDLVLPIDTVSPNEPTSSSPTVSGNTISWPDDGWYQVQSTEPVFRNICEGGVSCVVEAGRYTVINHTTGKRYADVLVSAVAELKVYEPTVVGNTISWDIEGWYQVQDATTYKTVCSGDEFCKAPPGNYIVINHTTGKRYEGVVVGGDNNVISVVGNTISWPNDGWYQVQNAATFKSVCGGGSSCVVENGSYIVINHTTGKRYENVRVNVLNDNGGGPPNPVDSVTSVTFDITVPAYVSNELQVRVRWGDVDTTASWIVDESWTASEELPKNTQHTLVVTFSDANGAITLGSTEIDFRTGTDTSKTVQINANQFDTERWDDDGDGISNIEE